MNYQFLIVDVFTTTRFGGNQLAVLPHADGLDKHQMQNIAREFNYSESTFVFPASNDCDRHVRIFTPTIEVPFAGHPNVGTAFALALTGELGEIGDGISITFDEEAGPVPVAIQVDAKGNITCELTAPQGLALGKTVDAARMASLLCLDISDIEVATHLPQVASVGLPFLFVELSNRDALARARADVAGLEKLREEDIVPDVHVYVRSNDDFDIRARMFAPLDGVPEDPATGSANCALVALLTHCDAGNVAENTWHIAQGVEMGRPSVLNARAQRHDDRIQTWIGGSSVMVAKGSITID